MIKFKLLLLLEYFIRTGCESLRLNELAMLNKVLL